MFIRIDTRTAHTGWWLQNAVFKMLIRFVWLCKTYVINQPFFFFCTTVSHVQEKFISKTSLPPTAFFEYKEDGGRFPNPPSYSVATTLPSYDEAERSKAEAAVPLVAGRVTVRLSRSQTSFRNILTF